MLAMAQAVVRRGLRAEEDEIRAVIQAANAPFEWAVPADFYGAYLASAMDVLGRMDVAAVLVIEQAERIVGTVTYFADAGDEGMPTRFPTQAAGLRATAVHPDAQGHGLGRSLVDACLERARLDGATSLALHTAPFMLSAVGLYQRAGFRRDERFDFPATAFFPSRPSADLPAMAYIHDLQ